LQAVVIANHSGSRLLQWAHQAAGPAAFIIIIIMLPIKP
jgi:hypothetical protein